MKTTGILSGTSRSAGTTGSRNAAQPVSSTGRRRPIHRVSFVIASHESEMSRCYCHKAQKLSTLLRLELNTGQRWTHMFTVLDSVADSFNARNTGLRHGNHLIFSSLSVFSKMH